MSYQFAHLETYSRKSTGKKLSVDQILAEADREPGACSHVEKPEKPTLIYGLQIQDLKNLHDRLADEATTTNNKGQTRKIRKDQQTLACIVLSYPQDGEDYNLWEDKSLEWLKEKYRENLKSVIKHTDESHPHLHCYLMAEDMKASQFNEGKKAKDAYMASSEAKELDSKQANKNGDKAYRQAMRAWQDSYWEKVGLPCGLSRIGPGKRRLSRDAWKKEQAQARYLKDTIQKGDKWGTDYKARIIEEARQQADKIFQEADKKLLEISQKIESKESELKEISQKNYIFRIMEDIRNQGFIAGLSHSSKIIKQLKSEITDLKESSSKEISRLNQYTLKLSSEKSKMETENNKLKREVSELKIELNKYNIDTSPTASYVSKNNI